MRAAIEFDDLDRLYEKIKQLPNVAEGVINEALHAEGIDMVTNKMTELMPMSKRNKKHAKKSKWSKSETFNLGFRVKSRGGAANKKGSFGYLVFPDEGRGPHNPWAQHFSDRTLVIVAPKIIDLLELQLVNRIQEGL